MGATRPRPVRRRPWRTARKAWCRRYLDWLGSERAATMGYDLAELRAEVSSLPGGGTGIIDRARAWRSRWEMARLGEALRRPEGPPYLSP